MLNLWPRVNHEWIVISLIFVIYPWFWHIQAAVNYLLIVSLFTCDIIHILSQNDIENKIQSKSMSTQLNEKHHQCTD